MKTFRPNDQEMVELRQAAALLKDANARIAAANKDVDAAKSRISQWLFVNRELTIDVQPIGEIIQVEGICLITRGKQNKFDEKRFALDRPALYLEYKRDFPISQWKPLV